MVLPAYLRATHGELTNHVAVPNWAARRAERNQRLLASLRCSFCGKPSAEVRKLIAGPTVYICEACVAAGHKLADLNAPAACCSFCGKPHQDVRKLVFGPTVFICDECLALCDGILADEAERDSRRPDRKSTVES